VRCGYFSFLLVGHPGPRTWWGRKGVENLEGEPRCCLTVLHDKRGQAKEKYSVIRP